MDDVFDEDAESVEFTARVYCETENREVIEASINALLAEGWHPEERIPLGNKVILIYSREMESNDE